MPVHSVFSERAGFPPFQRVIEVGKKFRGLGPAITDKSLFQMTLHFFRHLSQQQLEISVARQLLGFRETQGGRGIQSAHTTEIENHTAQRRQLAILGAGSNAVEQRIRRAEKNEALEL